MHVGVQHAIPDRVGSTPVLAVEPSDRAASYSASAVSSWGVASFLKILIAFRVVRLSLTTRILFETVRSEQETNEQARQMAHQSWAR